MPSILLIEDEPVLGRNIALALTRAGHRVTHVASALAARLALDAEGFALVIADISLGDGDGIDVVTDHAGRLSDVPVIIMTGQDTTANRLRAEGIAVSAFLAKPFAMSRLCELAGALMSDGRGASRQARGPSVMMYSHDTIGLGHMRRNTAIAEALVARVPGISVLMVIGCPAGMMFEPRPGIDYIKLPSLAKLGRDRWQAGSLRIDAATTQALRAGILERVVETFQPDLLLVDHEPTGVWNELLGPLEALRRRDGAKAVLGLRDILDDPDRTARSWAGAGTDRAIAGLYDEVMVYGNPVFYPSHSAYGLEELRPGHVRYCGAVTTVRGRRTRRIGGRPRHILVSGGGGRDAFALLDATLDALQLIPKRRRPDATLVAGPLMDAELRTVLRQRAEEAGVELHDQVSDMTARMAATDLLVTMAGYNSVTEALATGCPLLVVPRVGPSSEQRIRAERLEQLGLARVIQRPDLTAARLAEALSVPPPDPGRARVPLDFNGAERAAAFLAALLPPMRAAAAMAGPSSSHAAEQVSHV